MYKEKDLEDLVDPILISGEGPTDADGIRKALAEIAEANSVPFVYDYDQMKFGGLFNSEVASALIIKHPEHPRDYYGIMVAVQHTPEGPFAHFYSVGKSKQMKKFAISEKGKQQRKGQSLSFKVGNMAVAELMSLGKSKDKLAAEQEWYDTITSVIAAAICE